MNYFPFHLGDYAAHTAHLEPMEDLAYRRLLDQYYLREGALPADIQATAKLIRMRSMITDVESVLKEFFVLTEAGWTHARCENEITHMQDKQAKARASAAASVKSRQAFAAKNSKTNPTPVDETANGRSTGVENKQAGVELPTPTPTPTPTPVIKEERASAPVLPDWIPLDAWSGYVEMRKQIKKPMTGRAVELRIKDLEQFKADGHDLTAVLDQSTKNTWTDLYPPKIAPKPAGGKHSGFQNKDYREGVEADGTFA